jgi:hypothetical protein
MRGSKSSSASRGTTDGRLFGFEFEFGFIVEKVSSDFLLGLSLILSLSLSLSARCFMCSRFWFLRAVCAEPVSQQERQQTTIIWGRSGVSWGWGGFPVRLYTALIYAPMGVWCGVKRQRAETAARALGSRECPCDRRSVTQPVPPMPLGPPPAASAAGPLTSA